MPKLRSHTESLDALRELLRHSPGVDVIEDPANARYPMPMTSTYKHAVEVGRIRYNLIYGNQGIDKFVSGDQLLRGALLNAYEIMQLVSA